MSWGTIPAVSLSFNPSLETLAMARITGGEVTYMERRKIGDYEHKEAKAVLSFSLDDGDDHDSTLDTLTATAKARVHEMLGLVGKAISTPSTPAPAQVGRGAVLNPTTIPEATAPVKRGPGRPPKVNAPASAPVAEAPKAMTKDEVFDLVETLKAEPVVEAPVADDFALDEPAPVKKIEPDPVTEVTDAMLQSEVTKVMKKINNAIAIKNVIREALVGAGITNTAGKQLKDIPMPHRPGFLQHLGAL